MEQIFITGFTIEKVRHLRDIFIPLSENQLRHLILTGKNGSGKTSVVEALAGYLENVFSDAKFEDRKGLELHFNHTRSSIFGLKEKYHYILAYYKADRTFHAAQPEHVEKVKLKDHYGLEEFPRNEFVKYLLDLKTVEAFARPGKPEKAEAIQAWFDSLEQLLKKIFDDETVALEFDEETFEFHILQQGKEPFDFNTLSGG